jgi:hypothetical protein
MVLHERVRRRNSLQRCGETLLMAAALLGFFGQKVDALAASQPPTKAHQGFQINGTVVNGRDGSPVPFARLQATQLRPAPSAQAGGRNGQRGPGDRGAADASTGDAPVPVVVDLRVQTRAQAIPAARGRSQEDTSVTADAHGRFVLDLPSAGAWRLTASARGYRTQALDAHEGFASSVVLTETAPTYTVAFRMTRNASVSGTVFDEAGEPIERAQVQAEIVPPKALDGQPPAPFRLAGGTVTDDRGQYELANLAPGRYRVRVQATPWYAAGSVGQRFANGQTGAQTQSLDPSLDLVYPATWFPGAPDPNSAETLVLGDGEERQADFHLTAIPAAHLQVPLSPAAPSNDGRRNIQNNAMVMRVEGNGFGFGGGVTPVAERNDLGESGSLSPGIYQVSLGGSGGFNGFQFGSGDGDVREIEIRPGTSGVVSLADARPLTHVTLTFDGIEGRGAPGVLFTNSETGRQITATAPPRQPGARRGTADAPATPPAQERTVLVTPGRYQVALQSNTLYLTGIDATGAKATGRTVEIADGSPTLTLHVASGRATVSGFVRTGEKPLMGAMVVLVPALLGQADAIYATYRDQSNTDGSFLLPGVLPGRYILIAIDHGWDVDWRNPAVLAPYLLHGIPLELAAGAKAEETVAAQLP